MYERCQTVKASYNFLFEGSCFDLHSGLGCEPSCPYRNYQGDTDLLSGQGPLVRAQLSRRSTGLEKMHMV